MKKYNLFTQPRRLRKLGILVMLVGALFLPNPTPASAAINSWRLTGVMTTTVQVPNIYLSSAQVYQFQTNVEVIIDYARQNGPYAEQNPFSLVIQSTPLTNSYGEASVWSSLAAEGIIFQYWSYGAEQDGNGNINFAGELVNNHTAEALALNLITVPTEIAPNIWMPFTHAMMNGTQMQGTFYNNGQAHIVIQGNTTDSFHPFRLEIVASLGTTVTNQHSFSDIVQAAKKIYLPTIFK